MNAGDAVIWVGLVTGSLLLLSGATRPKPHKPLPRPQDKPPEKKPLNLTTTKPVILLHAWAYNGQHAPKNIEKAHLVALPYDLNKKGGVPQFEAASNRARVDGQLLAGATVPVIAWGFSAGSNAGVRQMLAHPEDRKKIVGVYAIDGLHWPINQAASPESPLSERVINYAKNVSGLYQAALAGARGEKRVVLTASEVPRPLSGFTTSAEALGMIAQQLERDTGKPGVPVNLPDFEGKMQPVRGLQFGKTLLAWYGGDNAQAHINQGHILSPYLIGEALDPF